MPPAMPVRRFSYAYLTAEITEHTEKPFKKATTLNSQLCALCARYGKKFIRYQPRCASVSFSARLLTLMPTMGSPRF